MPRPNKQRDYRILWIISLLVLVTGVLLTMRPAMIRPLGFTLLGLGAVGLVWSLARMDREPPGREKTGRDDAGGDHSRNREERRDNNNRDRDSWDNDHQQFFK